MTDPRAIFRGELTIVGAGIVAISQMSYETVTHIEKADCVFYHATNGVMAAHIRSLNPNCTDLYQYYGEGKDRRITYVQMAELMLREVRRGRRVVGVFHGHPGVFVMAARRSLMIAAAEGHSTRMLPAISSVDCLLADMRIDPGIYGLQIVKAGSVLHGNVSLAVGGHVVLLQISSVGDATFSFSGYKRSRRRDFFSALLKHYPETQETYYYAAPSLPAEAPEIIPRQLAGYDDESVLKSIGAGVLYIPPKGLTYRDVLEVQAFERKAAYGDFALEAIRQLDGPQASPAVSQRRASGEMLIAMKALALNADSLRSYNEDSHAFLNDFPTLSDAERKALETRNSRLVRLATRSATTFPARESDPRDKKM
jgi:Tetrapyrrole (Corrin/Porphyrin) Methylases